MSVCVSVGTSFTLRATRVVRRLSYIYVYVQNKIFVIFQMYFSASFLSSPTIFEVREACAGAALSFQL